MMMVRVGEVRVNGGFGAIRIKKSLGSNEAENACLGLYYQGGLAESSQCVCYTADNMQSCLHSVLLSSDPFSMRKSFDCL